MSPPPGALGASSLSRGNPPLTRDAAPPLLIPWGPHAIREQKMGRRVASPPLLAPRRPSFGKERQTGRRRAPATFHSSALLPFWRGHDSGLTD